MMCGRQGQLLMCEHGMLASESVAQCPKVAHAKCVGLVATPETFICPLHLNSCCGPEVREKYEAKLPAIDESISVPQSQVSALERTMFLSLPNPSLPFPQLSEKCEGFTKSLCAIFDAALPYFPALTAKMRNLIQLICN